MIKNLTIVGGGTAGLISALILKKRLLTELSSATLFDSHIQKFQIFVSTGVKEKFRQDYLLFFLAGFFFFFSSSKYSNIAVGVMKRCV